MKYFSEVFDDYYIVNVKWLCDNSIGVVILNRDQTKMKLVYIFNIKVRYDIKSKEYTELITEEDEKYLECEKLHFDSFRLNKDESSSFHIIWTSERNNFNHIYLYQFKDNKCTMINQVSYGDGEVNSVIHVDTDRELMYFSFI